MLKLGKKVSTTQLHSFNKIHIYTQLSSLCIHMLIFKRARSVIQLEMDT